jgi:hypothetical protein
LKHFLNTFRQKNEPFKKVEEILEILEIESFLATIHESGNGRLARVVSGRR